jgi:dTDP-4-amino-4,6-dideoxygalactose transaminase
MSRSTEFIPFARPSIGREEEDAVLSVLRSGWLTTAEQALSFEREFAEETGSSHAIAVNSATAGLHLSLEALGIGPFDTVLTTPYTFTATAEVVRYLGAKLRFADIEEESLTIDPAEVEKALEETPADGRRAGAVIPVHLGGVPCRMNELLDISRRYGTALVEDAAHAFPVVYRNEGGEEKCIGTLGKTGVYSFYATKTITTGEGGMIVTDDEALAKRMRLMRLHGIDREVWNRYTDRGASWRYDVAEAGYKYNLSDAAAALGRVQLKKARAFLQRRREIAGLYLRELADLDFLILPSAPQEHAWHLFIIRIVPERLRIGRDRVISLLNEEGIGTSVHYIPLHLMSYYRRLYGFVPEDFPVSLRVYQSAVSLPIYPSLRETELERIISAVRRIGSAYGR